MKAVLALLLGAVSAWDQEYTLDEVHAMDTMATFKAWSAAFGREYADLEEASSKFMTWLDNLYVIAKTNSQDLTYKLGLNQFSDLNGDEFRHYVHGDDGACFKGEDRAFIQNSNGQDVNGDEEPALIGMVQAPESVDWYVHPKHCECAHSIGTFQDNEGRGDACEEPGSVRFVLVFLGDGRDGVSVRD